jgi:hypothetical protein
MGSDYSTVDQNELSESPLTSLNSPRQITHSGSRFLICPISISFGTTIGGKGGSDERDGCGGRKGGW